MLIKEQRAKLTTSAHPAWTSLIQVSTTKKGRAREKKRKREKRKESEKNNNLKKTWTNRLDKATSLPPPPIRLVEILSIHVHTAAFDVCLPCISPRLTAIIGGNYFLLGDVCVYFDDWSIVLSGIAGVFAWWYVLRGWQSLLTNKLFVQQKTSLRLVWVTLSKGDGNPKWHRNAPRLVVTLGLFIMQWCSTCIHAISLIDIGYKVVKLLDALRRVNGMPKMKSWKVISWHRLFLCIHQ